MRIALVGNQDNGGYRIGKWMRDCGIDAHVYMFRMDSGQRSQPENIDRDIRERHGGRYPEWMHWYEGEPLTWFLKRSPTAVQIEKEYDAVVVSGAWGTAAVAHFRSIPIVQLAVGSEITEWPKAVFKLRASLRRRAAGLVVRRCLPRVNVIVNDYAPTIRTLSDLRLIDKMAIWSWPEDVKGNLKRVDQTVLAELNRQYAQYDITYLWLSRLNYLNLADSACKRPDLFLEAFRRTVHDDKRHVRAIIGTHGSDVEAFKELVRKYRLEDHIDWVPHLPYWKLLTYISLQNGVVFDEIGPNILGGLSRETLSVGSLLATTIDLPLMEISYGESCPVMDVHNADDCYRVMRELHALTPEQRQARRKQCLEWSLKYLHYDHHIRRLVQIIREAVYVAQVERRTAA